MIMGDFGLRLIAGFQEFGEIVHVLGITKLQENGLPEDGSGKLDTTSWR
jgi:hypothetical protein